MESVMLLGYTNYNLNNIRREKIKCKKILSKGIIKKCEHKVRAYISPIFIQPITWSQQIYTEPEQVTISGIIINSRDMEISLPNQIKKALWFSCQTLSNNLKQTISI